MVWIKKYKFHILFTLFLLFLISADIALLTYMRSVILMETKHILILSAILIYMELMLCNVILKGEINRNR